MNCQKRKQNITKKSPIFGPNSWLGTFDATKTDEISEKIQTAFDPPPSFSENYVAIFMMDMMEYMQGGTRARKYERQAHDSQRWGPF